MCSFLEDVRELERLCLEGLASPKEDLLLLETYTEIEPSLGENPEYKRLYEKLQLLKEDEDEELSFNMEMENLEGELGPEQETFVNKYPESDANTLLLKSYDDFILSVKSKPFYKTIQNYFDLYQHGGLNFVERNFLWKFLKAISSCLTHLLIEGEQREEAITLVEKYFDSLTACMNKVLHGADKQDVIQAFNYMVEFLGIADAEELKKSSEDSAEE